MQTVLLTDDNEYIVELVQLILKNSGYNLLIARDGVEAVDICLKQKPDLVLMDLNMPNMNGFDATRTLRAKGFTNPIIALTASELAEDRHKAEQAGFSGYILKTMDMKEVESKIDSFLQRGGPSFH
ncbi:MAG: putative transcriptional regulatory protein TcrX [Gammaproteobacteria bacterium]|nr:putative transcriptional regulatory protein TcrX [Gammaproteobacteria bacterium]